MAYQFDIETFLERSGFGGDDEPPEDHSRPAPSFFNRWTVLLLLFLIALLSANWLITTLTDGFWFQQVGYTEVWRSLLLLKLGTFVVLLLVSAALLVGNWLLARWLVIRIPDIFGERRLLEEEWVAILLTGVGLFFAWGLAQLGTDMWDTLIRYWHARPFGVSDPIFDRDIGFYIFTLPLYETLHAWLVQVLVLTLLGVAGVYAASQWENIQRRDFLLMPYIRKHGALLLAAFFLLWAARYQLLAWNVLYSSQGVVFGAGYTDVRASLPVMRLQMVLMLAAALVALFNYWRLSLRPMLAVIVLWVIVSVGGSLYAAVLQRYVVEPNELTREAPYIRYNIEATRAAYRLDRVEERAFPRIQPLTAEILRRNEIVLRNIRLWDERPLAQTIAQLQELRPYYAFSPIDVDRYRLLTGQVRQVMLAARELQKENLPARSWVNERLIFTHGYGLVLNPVDEVTSEGQPNFWIRNLPPESRFPGGGYEVKRPEIYYGQLMDDYVIVKTRQPEFDYPSGDTNVSSHYEGTGGVPLGSFVRRLLFAIRMTDPNLLLSSDMTPESRILFHRDISERVQVIAPFLTFDNDPYLVLDRESGRLFWVIDAYTTSDAYPYSTPRHGLNYIRNTVKVVVDAYNGSVTFYLMDESDPVVQAYMAAFPTLFTPFEKMPAGIREHIRYPKDLFEIQAALYTVYHMQDVQVFYNREDLWQLPNEVFQNTEIPMQPYYVVLDLPNDTEVRPEFLLIQPFTPANKANMIAWMAARNDEPNYGQLVVYEFPKQELIFGPMQVEARIDQDPAISEQLTLWSQQGSQIIRGNLLVIPLENSLLYVEPLYLLAETGQIPELKRVIVASGDQVVMRETLAEALTALVGAPVLDATAEEVASTERPPAPTEPRGTVDARIAELVRQANAYYEQAEAARVAGDWAAYGEALDALEAILRELEALVNSPVENTGE